MEIEADQEHRSLLWRRGIFLVIFAAGSLLFIWFVYLPSLVEERLSIWEAVGLFFLGLFAVLLMDLFAFALFFALLLEPLLWLLRLPQAMRLLGQKVRLVVKRTGPILRTRTLLRRELIGSLVFTCIGLILFAGGLFFVHEGGLFFICYGGLAVLLGVLSYARKVLHGSDFIHTGSRVITFCCPHCEQQLRLENIPEGKRELFSCSYCSGLIMTRK